MYRMMAVLLGLLASSSSSADEIEWLGVNLRDNRAAITAGKDSNDSYLVGIDTTLVMPNYSQLTLDVSRNRGANSQMTDYDNYFISLSSDPYARWSGRLSYQQSGNDKALETEDIELALQYFSARWLIDVGYSRGEVTAHFGEGFVRPALANRRSAGLDREGYSAGVEYFHEAWRYGVLVQQFNYDQDLPALQDSRRLQAMLGEQVLTQVFALTDWKVDFTVHRQWRTADIGLGLLRYRAIVDGEVANTVYAGIDQPLDKAFGVELLLARSTAGSLTYGELSVYYRW